MKCFARFRLSYICLILNSHRKEMGEPSMPWDFETEPEFQRELNWIDEFVRDEIEVRSEVGLRDLAGTLVRPAAAMLSDEGGAARSISALWRN